MIGSGLTAIIDGFTDIVDSLSNLTQSIKGFGEEKDEEETTTTGVTNQNATPPNPMQPNNNPLQFS